MKFTLLMLTRAYILYSYTQYLNTKFLYIFYTKTRGNGSEFFTTHIKNDKTQVLKLYKNTKKAKANTLETTQKCKWKC
jgi:hypothetical protein